MGRTVWIITAMPAAHAPRVRRQAQALLEEGYTVVVFGAKSHEKKPDGWILREYPFDEFGQPSSYDVSPKDSFYLKKLAPLFPLFLQTFLKKLLRQRKKITKIRWFHHLLWARYSNASAIIYYWNASRYTKILNFVKAEADASLSLSPDYIVGHDYYTLPIVDKLATDYGCKFSLDMHEYAYGQFMHNPLWRLVFRPWVGRLQNVFLPRSSVNTAVSDGISDLIPRDNPGVERPITIRSTPPYTAMPFRPTKGKIQILYHGIINPTRGIDTMLQAVAMLRSDYNLVIRGSGPKEYLEELQARIHRMNIAERVTLEPSVPFDEIIPAANLCDIGFFVHQNTGPQKHFTLPNKFFEYIMAGLALCVSDLPEMSKILKQHDLGALVKNPCPKEISKTLNSLSREDIDRYKRNSLDAAKILCWKNESAKMLSAFEEHMIHSLEKAS